MKELVGRERKNRVVIPRTPRDDCIRLVRLWSTADPATARLLPNHGDQEGHRRFPGGGGLHGHRAGRRGSGHSQAADRRTLAGRRGNPRRASMRPSPRASSTCTGAARRGLQQARQGDRGDLRASTSGLLERQDHRQPGRRRNPRPVTPPPNTPSPPSCGSTPTPSWRWPTSTCPTASRTSTTSSAGCSTT